MASNGRPILGQGTSQASESPPTELPKRQTSLEVAQQVAAKSKLNPTAYSFVPRTASVQQQANASELVRGFGGLSLEKSNNKGLIAMLDHITTSPASYAEFREKMVTELTKNDDALSEGVDLLISKAVKEPNLQYSVALFCEYCSQNVRQEFACGTFRSLFMKRLQIEHSSLANSSDAASHKRFESFTRLMAEIFLVLKAQNGGRFEKLRDGVQNLMRILIERKTESSIKAAVLTLKLAGAAMVEDEQAANNGTSPGVDGLMQSLLQLQDTMPLDPLLKASIQSLFALRAENWGLNETASSEQHPDQYSAMDPVFYDPRGHAFSWAELQEYGESSWPSEEPWQETYGPGDLPEGAEPSNYWPIGAEAAPSMWSAGDGAGHTAEDGYSWPVDSAVLNGLVDEDPEITDSYEQFLRDSGQA